MIALINPQAPKGRPDVKHGCNPCAVTPARNGCNPRKTKTLLLALLLALLAPAAARAQEETLTLYDGPRICYDVPLNLPALRQFTRSQFVIPADNLMEMTNGTISSMKFYAKSGSSFTSDCTVYVYLMEVDYTAISAFEPQSYATIVYQGTIEIVQTANFSELTVSFNQPYPYTGGNLLVGMDNMEKASSSESIYFYGTTVEGASISGLGNYVTNISTFQCNFIPKTSLTYTPSACGLPETLEAEDITPHQATLSWTGGSGTYNLETKTGNGEWTRILTSTTAINYTWESLADSMDYQARVQAVCGNETSGWRSVTFSTPIACFTPTGLAVTLNPDDTTEATLSWTENGEATAWQICLDDDEANLIEADSNPFTLTNLSLGTAHTVKVRAYCNDIDQSTWSNTVSFTPSFSITVHDGTQTNCHAPVNQHWSDEFARSQFVIPAADLVAMAGGTISGMTFYTTSQNIPFTYNKPVDVYLMEVDYKAFNPNNPQFEPKTNATIVYQGPFQIISTGNGGELTIYFSEPYHYNYGNLLVGIEDTQKGITFRSVFFYGTTATSASVFGTDEYWLSAETDDFIPKTTFNYTPSACGLPETLEAENITSHQATLTWTGGSGTYNVEIKTGDGEWTRVYTDLAANSCTLENLMPCTEYQARVQSVCDNATSDWRIVQIPMTITHEVPYSEGFESPQGTYWSEDGPIAACWRGYSESLFAPHNSIWPSNAPNYAHGTQALSFYTADANTYAILPEFSNPLSELQISFWMYIPGNNSRSIELGYITSEDNTFCNTFTTIATYYGDKGNIVQHNTVLADVPAEAQCLAFRWIAGEAVYEPCFIDDVEVSINPALIAPHDIAAANITNHEADITWEGACGSYALRYREIPTILKEGFEGGTMPQGWTIEGDNQDPARTWHVGIGDYNIGTGVHSGDYNALIKPKTNGQLTYLVTPALNLGEYASAELSFWYVNRKYGYNTDEFAVCYRNGNAGEWNELWSTDENHEGWTCQTVALTGLADNCQIGFRYTDRNANGVGLDDITIIAENTEWITVDETESPHTLTGLTTETTYEVQVKSNCEGYEDWSETLVFATLEACPVPFNVEASGIAATSAAVSWTGFSDSYDLSYRQAPGTLLNEGFEGGTMPQGWTIEGANQDPAKTWRVGVGDFDPATGTHSDNYNALITHNDYNQVTYLVTPALDLSEYGSVEISFWYVNRKWGGGIDELAVCYRIGNEGEWNQLWSTSENHQAWTSQTVALTGLADNYQIGFRCTDHYGYGVGLDDIALFDMTHSEWIILSEAESPHTLTGLMPETEYEVKVQGVCEDEPTDWSESAYFTTLEGTTFTKDIIAHTDNGGWYLIASPVAEAVTPTAQNGFLANEYDLYRFNQSAELEWENWKAEGEHYHFNLEAGRGYLYANSGDVTLTFVGTPHAATEPAEVPLAYDPAADFAGWNLVGNPLPEIAFIDRDFYVMNGDRDEIVAAEGNTVELMEGIFVIAEGENDTMTFTPASQNAIANNASLVVSLSQGRGSVIDRAIVRFNSNHTLPKFQLNPNSTKVYIPQGGKDYAVVAAEQTGEMPLNFKAAKNGTYTLTVNVENMDFDYLHLIDNLTGADVDLLAVEPSVPEPVEGPNATSGNVPSTSSGTVASYTFTAKTTDYASRFRLVFNANDASTGSASDAPFAYINNGNIIINGTGTLQIIDILGKELERKELSTLNSQLSTLNFVPGVYVLRLVGGDSVRTQKIVID